jgi:hypothetical protein
MALANPVSAGRSTQGRPFCDRSRKAQPHYDGLRFLYYLCYAVKKQKPGFITSI